jgi:hypothetical protein
VELDERPGFRTLGTIDGTGSLIHFFVCLWIDDEQTLCSNPDCIEAAYRAATQRAEVAA